MEPTEAPAALRHGNPLGVVSLVAGVVSMTRPLVYDMGSFLADGLAVSYQSVSMLISISYALLAIIAIVLGVMGLRARDRARATAIVGTTLGAVSLVLGVIWIIGEQIVAALLS